MFIGAAATALAFIAAATLAFGTDLWSTFFSNLSFVNKLVESGSLPWPKMPSVWVTLRTFGLPEAVAYAAHATVALAGAALVMWVWRRCGMTRLSWSVLIVATLMISHYLFDYELTLLAAPVAILMSDMAERGASRTEKLTLLACIILSGITAPLGQAGLPTGTVLLLAMLWLSATRALSAGRAAAGAPPLRMEAAATA
jgi:alpha-1,2-mannosyltransferase